MENKLWVNRKIRVIRLFTKKSLVSMYANMGGKFYIIESGVWKPTTQPINKYLIDMYSKYNIKVIQCGLFATSVVDGKIHFYPDDDLQCMVDSVNFCLRKGREDIAQVLAFYWGNDY